MDVEKFVRHLCHLVLRHQMPVWNYFVNSFYSVALPSTVPRAFHIIKLKRIKERDVGQVVIFLLIFLRVADFLYETTVPRAQKKKTNALQVPPPR